MRIIFFCLVMCGTSIAQGQLLSFGTTGLTIKSGTTIVADSITIIPTADFTFSNNTLDKFTSVSHTYPNPYISRVYRFNNSTAAFSGSIKINYRDGAELNGIPETFLGLNIHNGTNWFAFPASARDATNNFVLTNSITAVVLNELTLANAQNVLPVTWLSFTATRQNQSSYLSWTTMQEQNTRDFTVQHSTNGLTWTTVGLVLAAVNSNSMNNYSYLHSGPSAGINYYRVLQTDLDSRSTYSIVRMLQFNKTDLPFTVIGNPITNAVIKVQVHETSVLSLYAADGKLLWQENVIAGIKTIDVSHYARGTYLLKAKNTAEKILIQ